MEKTFFIIKPDGVRRGLVGEVLKRIEQRGLQLDRLELRTAPDESLIDKHYEVLVDKDFYPNLRNYMTSGPLVVGVISGSEAISCWRTMMGATNPAQAQPGTIRGDFAQSPEKGKAIENIVHGSDSPESAGREIALWFS
ncbi:nucleoside-diphosphate kinase [Lactococcus ileimucosae]|uniref:Nucleoside diphosphate kinase n=1 Tax=Lactococcus ileimucosae TaxID=2941329 RepID=A0ABV4D1Y3_9LACT